MPGRRLFCSYSFSHQNKMHVIAIRINSSIYRYNRTSKQAITKVVEALQFTPMRTLQSHKRNIYTHVRTYSCLATELYAIAILQDPSIRHIRTPIHIHVRHACMHNKLLASLLGPGTCVLRPFRLCKCHEPITSEAGWLCTRRRKVKLCSNRLIYRK